jgi:hypothetical protein
MPQGDYPNEVFVVAALAHNGGHGEWPAVVLVTPDPRAAVDAARFVEVSGYDIDWSDIGVWVTKTPLGTTISRTAHASTIVYSRGVADASGEVREYFFDQVLADLFGMTVSDRWEPSRPAPPTGSRPN